MPFVSRPKNAAPPIVQQGPVPVFVVTDIAAFDITSEMVQLTFCTDQHWGGTEVTERELAVRLVIPRSRFESMFAFVARVKDGASQGH